MKQGPVSKLLSCPSYKLVSTPPDVRLPSSKAAAQQRSINLAISSRGITALQAVDPAATARFLQTVIPMRGRMIHDIHGNQHSQQYDKNGQVGMLVGVLYLTRVSVGCILTSTFGRSLLAVHQLHRSRPSQ